MKSLHMLTICMVGRSFNRESLFEEMLQEKEVMAAKRKRCKEISAFYNKRPRYDDLIYSPTSMFYVEGSI